MTDYAAVVVVITFVLFAFLHNLCSAGASGKRGKRKREGQLPYEFGLNMAKGISITCRHGNILYM